MNMHVKFASPLVVCLKAADVSCLHGILVRRAREDREWLEALPYSIRFPSFGCVVVHAGLVPGVPLESQSLEAMTTMRNVKEGENGYEPIAYTSEGAFSSKGRF